MIELFTELRLLVKFELFTILAVFCIQIIFFIRTKLDIGILRGVFDQPLRTIQRSISDEGEVFDFSEEELEDIEYMKEHINDIVLLKSGSDNPVNKKIKDAINPYLINNRGAAVNYSIIKDIIDREIDAKDEEIAQSIPTPLYLGLAATIIGIIFGLFATPDLGENLAGINALINGIKIAMFASLSGLVWTIILSSWLYKGAKRTVINAKNDQLSYLQSNLLPELFKAEDAGVLGLKSSIDKFSHLADDMIKDLHSAIDNSRENISMQQQTLEKIEELNVTKVSKVNLELFERLEENMDSFHKFSEFIDQLAIIASNLQDFSSKTNNIDEIAQEIRATVQDSHKLTRFLTDHLKDIENAGDEVKHAVDLSQKHFEDAIENLKDSTGQEMAEIQELSDDIEKHFNKIYEKLFNKLDKVTENHITELTKAYSNNTPRFEQLNHLDHLEGIKKELLEISNSTEERHTSIKGNNEKLQLANKKLEEITHLLASLERNTNGLNKRSLSNRTVKPQKTVRTPPSRWAKVKKWFKKPFN
jgi:methyl-accepting chemotaxis protein